MSKKHTGIFDSHLHSVRWKVSGYMMRLCAGCTQAEDGQTGRNNERGIFIGQKNKRAILLDGP
jgi:hypothetical protein